MLLNFPIFLLSIFNFVSFGFAQETNKVLSDTNTKNLIAKVMPKYKVVGTANYSYLFWDIYDAVLITETGQFNNEEFILILKYNKVITKDRLVKETINEFKKQENLTQKKLNRLKVLFNKTYKKTKVGSIFVGIKTKNSAELFFEGKKVLTSKDIKFINSFFNIWLREDSQNPNFTKSLLGKNN